jgi:hypothetical protein
MCIKRDGGNVKIGLLHGLATGETVNKLVTAFLARLIDQMDGNIGLATGRGAEIKRRDRGTANNGADHDLSVDLQSGRVEQSISEYRSHLCSPVWRFQCSPSCMRAWPLALGWRKVIKRQLSIYWE